MIYTFILHLSDGGVVHLDGTISVGEIIALFPNGIKIEIVKTN